MIFFRRRLFAWLIKAYIKRWGKSILLFFGVGLVVFAILFLNINLIKSKIPITKTWDIGLVGSYSVASLPQPILEKVSKGLTYVSSDGNVHPAAAISWEIKDNGKTYIFRLHENIYFTDGKKLDSSLVSYNFSDATVARPDRYTIIVSLKDSYSPFLLTVSNRKIFKENFVGIGDYKITDIKTNGDFIQSIHLQSRNSPQRYNYKFFDSQEGLKTAFVLGEVDEMVDINDLNYKSLDFRTFKNISIEKNTNYQKLVTLFYDNQDKYLSDKRIRKALSYALPNEFGEGERNFTPFSPKLWVQEPITDPYLQDFAHSKLLLSEDASDSAKLSLTIKTLSQYRPIADEISEAWKQIGIKTLVESVDSVPDAFQVYLGDFPVLKDPDQYSIWHTGQPSNISNFRNLRIDKLLEDGRKTVSREERKKIYASFEKYLLDDAPASFLFFPYTYTVKRK